MKHLLLMRHAQTESGASVDDHDRPITEQGLETARRVGMLLYHEGLVPDRILSSSAARAAQTAEAVAEGCQLGAPAEGNRRLYLANVRTHIEFLRTLPDEIGRVMVVGHNPTLPGIVESLCGETVTMLPASLARVLLPVNTWLDLDEDSLGRLAGFWNPGDLP